MGLTAIYYTQTDDRSIAGGHTLLYDARCSSLYADEAEIHNSKTLEVALAVRPRLHRVLIFDSKIVHQGTAPSRVASSLRLSTVFKWKAVVQKEPLQSSFPQKRKRKKRSQANANSGKRKEEL